MKKLNSKINHSLMNKALNAFSKFALSTLLLATAAKPAFAEEQAICKIENQYLQKEFFTSETINYFFRVFPSQKYLGFAGPSSNYIMNLANSRVTRIVGSYDPVPLTDEVFSVPNSRLEFYRLSEALLGGDTSLLMSELQGVYQSVAILGNNKFRVIIDAELKYFQDFEVFKNSEGKEDIRALSPSIRLCSNLSSNFALPMISKKGDEISGYDLSSGTTKIWKINAANGNCQQVDDLKIPVGKADFSYDSRYLAFHINASQWGQSGMFSSPGDSWVMNIFIYDRHTKQVSQVTTNTRSSAYYPVFLPNGDVYYSTKAAGRQMSFVKANPLEHDLNGTNLNPNQLDFWYSVAVGEMWYNKCSPTIVDASPNLVALIPIKIPKSECTKLVDDSYSYFTNVLRDRILNKVPADIREPLKSTLTIANLKAKCVGSAITPTEPDVEQPPVFDPNVPIGLQIMQVKCASCHTQVKFHDLQALRDDPKFNPLNITYRIYSERIGFKMPLDSNLTADEKNHISNYIK